MQKVEAPEILLAGAQIGVADDILQIAKQNTHLLRAYNAHNIKLIYLLEDPIRVKDAIATKRMPDFMSAEGKENHWLVRTSYGGHEFWKPNEYVILVMTM